VIESSFVPNNCSCFISVTPSILAPPSSWISPAITPLINNLNYVITWYGKNRCKKIITKKVV
jgi:hypothetical protein